MRALTVKRPWAQAIAAGLKTIENRSWRPPDAFIGERIAIHAGAAWDAAGAAWILEHIGIELLPEECPAGRVVCTVVVADVVEQSRDPWFRGPLGWVLKDLQQATSRPMPGRLSLWRLDTGVVRLRP